MKSLILHHPLIDSDWDKTTPPHSGPPSSSHRCPVQMRKVFFCRRVRRPNCPFSLCVIIPPSPHGAAGRSCGPSGSAKRGTFQRLPRCAAMCCLVPPTTPAGSRSPVLYGTSIPHCWVGTAILHDPPSDRRPTVLPPALGFTDYGENEAWNLGIAALA